MTRTSSVARSAASLLTSRLAIAAIALAFLGVSTRLLTIEEMAVFAVYNSLCGILTVVCSLGLLASCIKLVPGLQASGRAGEVAGLLRLSIGVYLVGAAMTTGALWLGAGTVSRLFLKSPARAGEIRLAAVAALCFGLYEASQLLLSSLQKFGRLSTYNVAAALVQRCLSLGLFFVFGLRGYLAGFAIGSLTGAALGMSSILPAMRARGGARPSGPAASIRYALPFYADGYLRYFYMHADQALVGLFLEPAALSTYFIAKRFVQYGQVLVSSLVDPLGAKVAELRQVDPEAVGRAFDRSLRYVILSFVPLAVLLASVSPFLLWLIGGERYLGGILPLALLFLSLPPFAVFSHLAMFVYILGEPKDRFVNNLVSVTCQGSALVALTPFLALPGFALARVIGFGGASLYARHRATRYLPPRRGVTSGGARRAWVCLLPAGAMAAMIVVPHLLLGRLLLIPLYAVPAVLVCLAGYHLLVLTSEDRQAAASLVPGRGSLSRRMKGVVGGGTAGTAETDGI